MMLDHRKIGSKSLAPTHGSTHFQSSAEVGNQWETVSIGQLSRASRSWHRDRPNSRELSKARSFKEFLTDLFLTQTRETTMQWEEIKLAKTILQAWLWINNNQTKTSKWLALRITTLSCTIKMGKDRTQSVISTKESSRTKDEQSSCSSKYNKTVK